MVAIKSMFFTFYLQQSENTENFDTHDFLFNLTNFF